MSIKYVIAKGLFSGNHINLTNKKVKMDNILFDITCSETIFNNLKTDERFLNLLTLARVVNALNFCHKATVDAKNSSEPDSARSTINSFLYASSILYEGFKVVDRLQKNFKNLDSFKTGFGALLKDKNVKKMRESVLKQMRNRFVFHFDRDVAMESFKNFKPSQYNFAIIAGITSGEMYYSLADEVVMNYLLQPAPNESDESMKQRFIIIIQDIADIMCKFNESAERLMKDVLKDMDLTIKPHKY